MLFSLANHIFSIKDFDTLHRLESTSTVHEESIGHIFAKIQVTVTRLLVGPFLNKFEQYLQFGC